MALPILDGNQTAATLSTVLTGGEHIPAHTVVSLGSQAITDVRSAVSGSVVSISNFPSTQTIAGTVTAILGDQLVAPNSFSISGEDASGFLPSYGVQVGFVDSANDFRVVKTSQPLPISGTVTVGSLPDGVGFGQQLAEGYDNYGGAPVQIVGSSITQSISGTVTANVFGKNSGGIGTSQIPIIPYYSQIEFAAIGNVIPVQISNNLGVIEQNNRLPISGTVTANNPNGELITRFGSVVTANLAFITSAVTNTSRKYLLAQNISAGTVTIGIGFSPTTTQGIQLTAGAGLTFDSFCPTGAVFWLGAVTGAAFTILEG